MPVDTLCLVKGKTGDWKYIYFAMYDKSTGTPRFWSEGRTSKTKLFDDDYGEWSFYRLYKEGE